MFCFAPRYRVFLSAHTNSDTRKQSIHKDDRPNGEKSRTVRVGSPKPFYDFTNLWALLISELFRMRRGRFYSVNNVNVNIRFAETPRAVAYGCLLRLTAGARAGNFRKFIKPTKNK